MDRRAIIDGVRLGWVGLFAALALQHGDIASEPTDAGTDVSFVRSRFPQWDAVASRAVPTAPKSSSRWQPSASRLVTEHTTGEWFDRLHVILDWERGPEGWTPTRCAAVRWTDVGPPFHREYRRVAGTVLWWSENGRTGHAYSLLLEDDESHPREHAVGTDVWRIDEPPGSEIWVPSSWPAVEAGPELALPPDDAWATCVEIEESAAALHARVPHTTIGAHRYARRGDSLVVHGRVGYGVLVLLLVADAGSWKPVRCARMRGSSDSAPEWSRDLVGKLRWRRSSSDLVIELALEDETRGPLGLVHGAVFRGLPAPNPASSRPSSCDFLEFREVLASGAQGERVRIFDAEHVLGPFERFRIDSAHVSRDVGADPAFVFRLRPEDAARFTIWTGARVGRRIVPVVCGRIARPPVTIQGALPGEGFVSLDPRLAPPGLVEQLESVFGSGR